ncbi:hypothetical protein [Actinoplanes sp. NPDC048796]|uniref:hypothetical protein n=1 Tax=Actinoplanes sp. NPDC048796 TaxID=3155640 RepID=UPI0033DB0976
MTVPVPGRRGELPDEPRRRVLAADAVEQAVPLAQIDDIDAEAVLRDARGSAGLHVI